MKRFVTILPKPESNFITSGGKYDPMNYCIKKLFNIISKWSGKNTKIRVDEFRTLLKKCSKYVEVCDGATNAENNQLQVFRFQLFRILYLAMRLYVHIDFNISESTWLLFEKHFDKLKHLQNEPDKRLCMFVLRIIMVVDNQYETHLCSNPPSKKKKIT